MFKLILVLVIIIVILVFLIEFYFQKQRKTIRNKKTGEVVKGPPAILSQKKLLTKLPEQQEEIIEKYGDVSTIFLFSKLCVVISNPETIKDIMVNQWETYERPDVTVLESMKELVEESLFSLDTENWRITRKALNSGFKYNFLNLLIPTMVSIVNKLGDIFEYKLQNNNIINFDLQPWLTRFTTEIIGVVGFGLEFGALDDKEEEDPEFVKHVNRIMSESTNILAYIPYYYLLPTPGNKSIKKAVKAISIAATEVIKKRKQLIEENNNNNENIQFPNDLLQIMIENDHFSSKSIISNAMGFLIAGSETTSISLAWTLFELAKNQDIQEKARKEILSVINEDDKEITLKKIQQLKYLQNIIKESLRFYPPAWMNARVTPKDEAVEIDNVILPPKTILLIPILGIHRSKKYWGETADQFIPERWDKENITSGKYPEPPRGAYLPFNIGIRDCIGKRFADLEMKIALTVLLTKFQFTPVEGFVPGYSMNETLKPKNGMKLNLSLLS